MSFTAATVWEMRPSGAFTNGIGFDPAFGGTDYSQQDSPQLTITDASATNTTTITSAAQGGFTGLMVGNGVNVNGALFQVTAVTDGKHIVVDRAAGTFSGQTLKLGGAGNMNGGTVSSLPMFDLGVIQPGNVVWIRGTNSAGVATNYTPTVTFGNIQSNTTVFGGAEFNFIRVEGYTSTRGDGGIAVITVSNGGGGGFGDVNLSNFWGVFKNLRFNGQSGTGSRIFMGFAGGAAQFYENIVVDQHLAATGTYGVEAGNGVLFRRCWFISPPSPLANVRDVAGLTRYEECRLDGASGGTNLSVEALTPRMDGCIMNGGDSGILINQNSASVQLRNSILWGCGLYGLNIPNTSLHEDQNMLVENCIFGNNGTFDIRHQTDITGNVGAQWWVNTAFRCNWFFTKTTRYSGMPAASDDHTLTANPFNNSAGGDFSLNTVTGGGAAITATPCSFAFPDGLNTAKILPGYYGVVPTGAVAGLTLMRSLWRELTNERDTTVIPDSTVDIYLDFGLQELHRRLHYNVVTDSTSVTLVAAQQEYTMPADSAEIVFVQYGSNRLLEKGSVEQWRRRGEDWRNEPLGEPRFWAHYGGNNFVIRPAPSALAVAAAPNLAIRSKQTPGSITTSGTGQLPSLYWRLAVLYGAYLWSACYPDSVVAQQRAAVLKAEFDAGTAAAIEDIARKDIAL